MSALDDYLESINAQTESLINSLRTGNSQQQWESALEPKKERIPGSVFLAGTGRINAGIGTGDKAVRDSSGNITGYNPRSRGSLTPGLDKLAGMQLDMAYGKPLATASPTPGLDALHDMQKPKVKGLTAANFNPGPMQMRGPTAGGFYPAKPSWYTVPKNNVQQTKGWLSSIFPNATPGT